MLFFIFLFISILPCNSIISSSGIYFYSGALTYHNRHCNSYFTNSFQNYQSDFFKSKQILTSVAFSFSFFTIVNDFSNRGSYTNGYSSFSIQNRVAVSSKHYLTNVQNSLCLYRSSWNSVVQSSFSVVPTLMPLAKPTTTPVANPTTMPVFNPTTMPLANPTLMPVSNPTTMPLEKPTTTPVSNPTTTPVINPTTMPVINPTTMPVFNPTTMPVSNPTTMPLEKPTTTPVSNPTTTPVINPTTMPVINPTTMPVINPTTMPVVEPTTVPVANIILSFESIISLSGLTEPILDTNSQTAIVIATAKSANVSKQYVTFVKQTLVNIITNKKKIQSYTYDIDAITQLTIPVKGSPEVMYSVLTNNIANSVGNNDFTMFLMSASIALNSTTTQNAFSKSVACTSMILSSSSSQPSPLPTKHSVIKKNNDAINDAEKIVFIVIVISVVSIFVISSFIKAKSQQIENIILDIENI